MASAKKDKWLKYQFLKSYAPLAPHVPETRFNSQQVFWDLLAKYRHVILKPVWGKRGRGVIQVSSIGNDRYALHYENIRKTIQGKDHTYGYIQSKIGSASYMVQQRVNRPTIGGRPFDMRVVIQRRRNSPIWVVTGKVIKVAGKGYIVSNNSRSKGTLLYYHTGIRRSSIRHLSAYALESNINHIALHSAQRLSALYPNHRRYGLDMGPDRQGHIWIIEANLFPASSHFRKLKDKTMYRRIISFKKG